MLDDVVVVDRHVYKKVACTLCWVLDMFHSDCLYDRTSGSKLLFSEDLVAGIEDKCGELQEEDDGDAEGELVFVGLVVECSHC